MIETSSKKWSIDQLFTLLDHDKDGFIETKDMLYVVEHCTNANEACLNQIRTAMLSEPKLSYNDFNKLFEHPMMSIEQIDSIRFIAEAFCPAQPWVKLSETTKHLIAGGVAGAISRTVVNPMERIKILFQIQGPDSPSYRGIWPTLKKIWVDEGFKGLMAGNGTNVIRIIPYSASQFASYEYFKQLFLKDSNDELEASARLISGALAGIVSVVCTYPLDMVKTRLAIQSASLRMNHTANSNHSVQKLSGIVPTMINVYRNEGGISGLYRGVVPTTLGVSPYVAISFWSYETLKSYVDNETPIKRLACGALAGSIAQTITYPLDVLRRRFQVIGTGNAGYKYSGTLDALKTMVRQEGAASLYKGLLPNYLKVAPAIGVSFVSYEACKDVLNRF
ncbi:mitochondrial carrier [Hesseltinella vesiculosa]|uniref:Mitochondrial carrier n=1 Tax=Hesseltinella vesiculosa TaxID=101127 RepID=A0A1X2G462_9FUNG|nr:mitochondrial carrier [Hesseltinella vesiculosa]